MKKIVIYGAGQTWRKTNGGFALSVGAYLKNFRYFTKRSVYSFRSTLAKNVVEAVASSRLNLLENVGESEGLYTRIAHAGFSMFTVLDVPIEETERGLLLRRPQLTATGASYLNNHPTTASWVPSPYYVARSPNITNADDYDAAVFTCSFSNAISFTFSQ